MSDEIDLKKIKIDPKMTKKVVGNDEIEVSKGQIMLKNDSKDLYQSPKQIRSEPILAGLDIPSQTKGPFSPLDRERWKVVITNLLVRGIGSGRKIASLLSLSVPTAAQFVKEVKESWQDDLTPARINETREILLIENQKISEYCWAMIEGDPLDKKANQGFLKIIGEANNRQAKLVGVDNININVSSEIKHIDDPTVIQTQVAQKLGIAATDLKDLGNMFSQRMNIEQSDLTPESTSEQNNDNIGVEEEDAI